VYLTQERQIEIDEFLRSFPDDGATSNSKSLVVPVGIVKAKTGCGAGSGEGGGFGPGNTCASSDNGNAQILSWAKERFEDDETAKNFVEWFGDSKAVDADGNPLEMFHGSGNVDGFHEFKPEFTGKGNDQIGSGYYLTNDIKDAGRYTDDTQGSGIVMAFVSVQNPIDTDGDLVLDFTKEQLAGILKKSPGIYDVDESSMGDWHDIWSEGGVQDWMIEDVAEKIMTSDLNALESDFFPEDSGLFRQLVHEATGYDGVVKRFDDGTVHFSAWFPNQIKASLGNEGTFDPDDNDIRKAIQGMSLLHDVILPPEEPTNVYGYCPKCSKPGKSRERRPNGNDTCEGGCVYPSADSVEKAVSDTERPLSCVMFELDEKIAKRVKAVQTLIDPDDLHEEGLEEWPHITARFGLHEQDAEMVIGFIQNMSLAGDHFRGVARPIEVTIGTSSVFELDEYDVLKLNVSGDNLNGFHDELGTFPHTDTYPEYKPHITLAYLKPGTGEKYLDIQGLDGTIATLNQLVFSNGDKEKTRFTIGSHEKSWDESKVTRHPSGTGDGGRFAAKEGGQSVSGFYFNGELRNETVSIKPDAVVVDVRSIDTAESASGGFIANEMFDDMEELYGWDDHSWQVRGVDPESVTVDSTYVGNLANDHEFGEYLKDKHGVDVIRSGDKNAILNGDVIDDDNFERVTKRDVNREVMEAIQKTTHLAQDILPKLKEFDTNAEKLEFVRGLIKDDPWLKAERPTGLVGNIHDKIVKTLNDSGINGNHKNKNHTAMMAAVGTFSEDGQREIAVQLQDVKWFGNPKQLTQHFRQNPREELIAGAWHDDQNRLYLDGDSPVIKHDGEAVNAPQFQGVYAHELGHVVDGGTSESTEWKEAWESEMNDSQLTNYAASQPAEGYAELVRVWSTGEKRDELEKQFPKSVAILKSQGVF